MWIICYINVYIFVFQIICFWKLVGEDGKLPTLLSVVRQLLILPHGNAECERTFCILRDDLRDRRLSLSDVSVNALLFTRCYLLSQKTHGKCTDIAVEPRLIHLAKTAHAHYKQRIEEEKKRDIQMQRKKREDAIGAVLKSKMESNVKSKELEKDALILKESVERAKKDADHARETLKQAQRLEGEKLATLREKEERLLSTLEKQSALRKRLASETVMEMMENSSKRPKL